MYRLFRRSVILFLLLLLLTPVAIFARSDAARQFVELIFSDDKSEVSISETVQSTARVTFTHDGKDYQMHVPVTIAIDDTVPLVESTSVTDSLSRVGVYAVEILRVSERTSEVQIGYSTYAPSNEEHKLVFVVFEITNLSATSKDFGRWSGETAIGLDEIGRRFEMERLFECDEVNPGGTARCAAMFNVHKTVTLTKVEIIALDENTLALPEPQQWGEE